MPADELFGPDGTQALQVDTPLGDPLGGLVTGATFALGNEGIEEQPEQRPHRVVVPDAPEAPDQGPLKLAMDKAMMTGPPTNPLRLPAVNAALNSAPYVRSGPTVALSKPAPRPIARRDNTRQQAIADNEQIQQAMRASLAGRPSFRRSHPVASGLLRVIIPLAFVVLLLILVLHGSGGGGNLSDLFG